MLNAARYEAAGVAASTSVLDLHIAVMLAPAGSPRFSERYGLDKRVARRCRYIHIMISF